MIRMLIVDDEYYIRLGIVHAFNWAEMNIEIVGDAENGEEGLQLAIEKKPDLILLDICMPLLNGLELMQKLQEEKLDCALIVLSGYDEFEYAQKSLQFGVLDYLLKPIDKLKLKETIQKACLTIRNKKSIQNYQSFALKEQSNIKNQFLQDLLLGNLTDEAVIQDKISFLKLPLLDGPYQIFCVQLDDFPTLENLLSIHELHDLKELITRQLSSFFSLGKAIWGCSVLLHPTNGGHFIIYSILFTRGAKPAAAQQRETISNFF